MSSLTHTQLEELWISVGGPAAHADVAAAVAQAESGGDPSRIDNTEYPGRPFYHAPQAGAQPEYSVGLWQINMLAHPQYPERSLLTTGGNALAALSISNKGEDFGAWTTYTNGAYEKYLTVPAGATVSGPPKPSSGDTATGPYAPSAHGGWHAVNVALSRQVPQLLRESYSLRHAAERNLARRSRHH